MKASCYAHAALMLLLLVVPGEAQEAVKYRFQQGDQFTYLVAQESKPAQGPETIGAELVYRFEVKAVEGGTAQLEAKISGKGSRGPDEASNYAEARKGRSQEFTDVGVSFRLTESGVPVSGEKNGWQIADAQALALTPARQAEEGDGEWAMVQNTPQFFPFLGSGGEAKLATTIYGPNIFRLFPNDTPEVEGLLWTKETAGYKALAPKAVEVGGKSLLRVDFLSGFTKRTTHRGLNFRGTYTMAGFALIDPALGRPVAYKVDDTRSQYRITVSGGNILTLRIAKGRLEKANNGRTPIRLEAVDPAYLHILKDYAGLDLIQGSEYLRGHVPQVMAEEPSQAAAPAGETSGIFGM